MVKNLKLLIVAIGSFISVHAQDTTKAAVLLPKWIPFPLLRLLLFQALWIFITGTTLRMHSGFNNNYTSFTNSQNSFELGMATIRADHSWAKAGVTVELGFGRRAQEFSYNEA